MCGFITCLNEKEYQFSIEEQEEFKRLNNFQFHRGPDDFGYYFDDYMKMGFRRLCIIDLEKGKQPLSFENERYWIVFNGEIYNYLEIRERLINQGVKFETNSDTEVILALFILEHEEVVKSLRGMFAFVIWDKEKRELFAARDPFGIKPLYFYTNEEQIWFSSEKKSLLAMLGEYKTSSRALQYYLSYQYVPEPCTLTDNIQKVLPGHYVIKRPYEELQIEKYWQASFQSAVKSEEEWVHSIRDILFESVQMHMRSDVPVGSFLSGGIDSTVIATMAKEYHPEIKTFSVGFFNEGYNEISLAQETAEKIGVENICYLVSVEEYMKELPKIIWYLDDPLADPACVPLYFVAREAAKHVKVVLSGEGADELFGGYNIYREPHSLRVFEKMPSVLKRIFRILAKIIPEGVKGKSFLERGLTPIEERYIGNAKMFEEHEKKKLLYTYNEDIHYRDITKPLYNLSTDYHPVERMQYVDIQTWLRGDILLKADRMTMAHSLELRVPFLDKEVFKVASTIPSDMKINHQTTKFILRKAVEKIVPDSVLYRRKLGFPVPIRVWLKEEMYDWAIQIIKDSATDHLINKQIIYSLLEKHRKGNRDYSRKIWTVLVFMIWHAIFVEKVYTFEEEHWQRSTFLRDMDR